MIDAMFFQHARIDASASQGDIVGNESAALPRYISSVLVEVFHDASVWQRNNHGGQVFATA